MRWAHGDDVRFCLHWLEEISHFQPKLNCLIWTHQEQEVPEHKTKMISSGIRTWGTTGVAPSNEIRKKPDRMSGFFYSILICLVQSSISIWMVWLKGLWLGQMAWIGISSRLVVSWNSSRTRLPWVKCSCTVESGKFPQPKPCSTILIAINKLSLYQ